MRALFLAVAATAAFPNLAQASEQDFNLWLAQTVSIDAGGGAVVWLEAQERFTNDASRLGQLLLRPAVGYRLDGSTTAFIGYAYVRTDPPGPTATHEHRIFQQLSFRIVGNGKGPTLTGRSRLEQRFLNGAAGTGWRFRQQIRLAVPVSEKVSLVGWTEPFIGLNETAFQRDGVGIWRNFAGVAVPVGKRLSLEGGYLRQDVVRPGRDRTDQTLSITLNARL